MRKDKTNFGANKKKWPVECTGHIGFILKQSANHIISDLEAWSGWLVW